MKNSVSLRATSLWARGLRLGLLSLLAATMLGTVTQSSTQPAVAEAGTNTLYANQELHPGQVLRSANGMYTLEMQFDGNLVIYAPGHIARWSTGTRGNLLFINQGDGNLALYTNTTPRRAVWNSQTAGRGVGRLVLQDDQNLVLYRNAGGYSWASNTAVSATPQPALRNCTVSGTEQAIDSEEQALLNGINAYRAQYGLRPLTFDPTLNRAAAWMSRDMADYGYVSHTDRFGRTIATRLPDCGHTLRGTVGENLAAGQTSAAGALDGWKNSPAHNAILLSASFTTAGIGRYYDAASPYRFYWTLNVGRD